MSLAIDGIPTNAECEATATRSIDAFFDEVIPIIEDDSDPVGLAFGLFINLAHHLAAIGWTPDELAREAATHAAHQTSEGSA